GKARLPNSVNDRWTISSAGLDNLSFPRAALITISQLTTGERKISSWRSCSIARARSFKFSCASRLHKKIIVSSRYFMPACVSLGNEQLSLPFASPPAPLASAPVRLGFEARHRLKSLPKYPAVRVRQSRRQSRSLL